MQPTALVTGGSRGIGRGIVLALASEGYRCVINYVNNSQAAQNVRAEVEKLGASAICVQGDVSSARDRQKLLDETLGAFGSIDVLVNNAGVAPLVRVDVMETTEESFDRLININCKGPYFLTQLVAKHMIGQVANRKSQIANPKIITISSLSSYAASITRGEYCVSKAGLAMMSKIFALRLAEYGIGVYDIRPGIIDTDLVTVVRDKYDKMIKEENLTPIARWGTPEDVGKAVIAIVKDLLPFSTGEVINVDGGFHLRRL